MIFSAVMALLLQPLLLVPFAPHASAATLQVTPDAHSIDGGTTATSTVNAAGYKDLVFSFDHVAESLEIGDRLEYGWRTAADAEDMPLGVVEGAVNVDDVSSEEENGSKSYELPAQAAVDGLTLYFRSTGSANVTVEVSNISLQATLIDTIAPTIANVRVPSAGTYLSGSRLEFVVSYDEVVSVEGTPQIALIVGSTTKHASYVSGSGSTSLTFVYQVGSADRDTDGIVVSGLDLAGGTIKDQAGNDASTTLRNIGSTTGIIIGDIVAPVVTASGGGEVTGSSASLTGTSDDSSASYVWQLVSGPGIVSFGAPTALSSGVQLIDNQYGRYVFQLRARDGAGNESLSNEIAVTFFRPITPSVVTPPAELPEVPLTPLTRITPRVIPPLPAGANTRIYTNTELLNGGDEAGRGSTENEGLASIDAVGAQAIAPSTQGWKIFGTAWYWWLFVVAGVVGTWLVVAAAIRRRKALGEVEV